MINKNLKKAPQDVKKEVRFAEKSLADKKVILVMFHNKKKGSGGYRLIFF